MRFKISFLALKGKRNLQGVVLMKADEGRISGSFCDRLGQGEQVAELET